jgi:hypothetical protein
MPPDVARAARFRVSYRFKSGRLAAQNHCHASRKWPFLVKFPQTKLLEGDQNYKFGTLHDVAKPRHSSQVVILQRRKTERD